MCHSGHIVAIISVEWCKCFSFYSCYPVGWLVFAVGCSSGHFCFFFCAPFSLWPIAIHTHVLSGVKILKYIASSSHDHYNIWCELGLFYGFSIFCHALWQIRITIYLYLLALRKAICLTHTQFVCHLFHFFLSLSLSSSFCRCLHGSVPNDGITKVANIM